MKYFQEVTTWTADYQVPNHIYYMRNDKSRAVGYIKAGTTDLFKFSKPMAIDTRGRKFKELTIPGEPDEVYFAPEKPRESRTETATVAGSGGKVYTLTKIPGGWSCTCTGYLYRRKCKHVDQLV